METDYSTLTRIIMTVIFASLTLVGVVGNLLVVVVVKRVPGMVRRMMMMVVTVE